jgi:hypothetical protein
MQTLTDICRKRQTVSADRTTVCTGRHNHIEADSSRQEPADKHTQQAADSCRQR